MSIADFIQDYGYLAVALGSFLEGEAVLLAGSLAAYHGHLEWPLLLPIAAFSSFLGDLPYFFAGRRYGTAVLTRYPLLQHRQDRLEKLLYRHHILLVLSLRFLYGLRIAGLLTLGVSKMSSLRFLCLNFIGAVIWTSVVISTGYGIGRLIQALIRDAEMVTRASLLAAILITSSAFVVIARRRRLADSQVNSS
jgi:membrane protein DedA with SNARE-associated domain